MTTTLDAQAVRTLLDRARREVDEGHLPSVQIALGLHGEIVVDETFGDATADSRYVIFSSTKAFIASVMWQLIAEGRVDVSKLVIDVIPEFGTNGKDVITVEQLLTHTSGFPTAPLAPVQGATSAGRCERFAQWRLNWEPGTRFEYHPTSAHWVLGEIIERVSGTDTPTFVHERIMVPLGLGTFRLGEPPERQGDINDLVAVGEQPTPDELEAAIGIRIDLAELIGEVTTEALLAFNQPEVRAAGMPGGGGISTAADIALYYQGVLHNRDRLWDPAVLAAGTVPVVDLPDPIRGMPAHRSRGLMVAGDPPDAQLRGFGFGLSPRTYGHDGAGGQIAWVDPDSGISFCYLTNGLDEHVIRQARRGIGINTRAAACAASA